MARYATIDAQGGVVGFYSDAIQSSIPQGAIALTDAQYQAWIADTTGQIWSVATGALVPREAPAVVVPMPRAALDALSASDRVVLRCYEHGVPVPTAWAAYRAALRGIVNGTSTATAIPVLPPYPTGT